MFHVDALGCTVFGDACASHWLKFSKWKISRQCIITQTMIYDSLRTWFNSLRCENPEDAMCNDVNMGSFRRGQLWNNRNYESPPVSGDTTITRIVPIFSHFFIAYLFYISFNAYERHVFLFRLYRLERKYYCMCYIILSVSIVSE